MFSKDLVRNFPEAYSGRFLSRQDLRQAGQTAKAEKEFKKALEIEPALLEPRFELLDLYRGEGRSGIIPRTYVDIVKNNPFNIRASSRTRPDLPE
ncbi:MAG: hypothetical protein U5R30_12820 [Deltaproteobacteria bacterium]|nr:hypothetical protein [Deltaproteobacteria bacterium]